MDEANLVFGYEPDFAPLTFAQGKEARGLIIDLLVEALQTIGFTANFVPVGLPEHEAALRAGRIDALAFKAIIAGRAGDFDFSAPLINSGAAWFVLPAGRFAGDRPRAGARLATPARGPLIAQLREDFPEADFVPVETYAQALGCVADGEADCAALNFHVGCSLANRDFPGRFEMPGAPFQDMPIGCAFAKGAGGDQLGEFNRALREMRASGVIVDMERRWLAAGA